MTTEPQVTAPVQLRGLDQLLRDRGPEVGPGDDDLPDPDRLRNDQRPPGVQQPDGLDHQVRRDQAAGEQHREEDQRHHDVPADQRPPRHRIGDRNRHRDADDRADDGVEQRVQIPLDDLRVLEHRVVPAQRELHRPEQHPPGRHRRRAAERAGHDVQQRQQDDRKEDRQQQVHTEQEDPIGPRLADPAGPRRLALDPLARQRSHFTLSAHDHSPFPVIRLATVLTISSSTRLITELNSPTAVAMLKSAFSRPVL